MAEIKKTIPGPNTLRPLREVKDEFLKAYYDYTNRYNMSDIQMAAQLGVKPSTLRDTLNADSTNFNANIVIAFCLKFKTLDIEKLYLGDVKEPEALKQKAAQLAQEDQNRKNFTIIRHSYDCHELTDPAFIGTFYGYCRNTQYHNSVESFMLHIGYNTHNEMQAKLELTTHNQKKQEVKKVLYGKPMHLEPNMIYIVLQSNVGDDMFIITYNWFKLNLGKKLYCRYGSLTTPCRSTDRYPQQQSFIMLDKPVAPEHTHYVDGFLHLSQDKIIVPANKYDAEVNGLMATNEKVKEFFGPCQDLQYGKEQYYCFSEKVLLAMGDAHEIDYDTTAATIMTLKENSINPKVVDFPNNKTYSKFFAALTTDKE